MLEEFTGGKSVDDWIRVGFDTSGVERPHHLGGVQGEGPLRGPQRPRLGEARDRRCAAFAEDPENHPLTTPTGKLEFFSQRLADNFPDDDGATAGAALGGARPEPRRARSAATGPSSIPYLCISNHPRWRVHSQHDDMQWLREIETCKIVGPGRLRLPDRLDPSRRRRERTASSTGDIVKVFNERGAVLVGAYVTERVMPGVVYVDHGARYDPIVPGELDRGGAINTITPRNTTSKNATGMVSGGFLVECERADLEALRKQYPEAFARPYDKGTGLAWERMLA